MLRAAAHRIFNSSSSNRFLATICSGISYLKALEAPSSSYEGLTTYKMLSTASVEDKLHLLKGAKGAATPVSQAVAFMISKDQMPQQQLEQNMHVISQQLLQDVASYSSTELSAFTEACRQLGYVNKQAFAAVIKQLAPASSQIAADELPSLLWAGARLAADKTGSSSSIDGPSAGSSRSSSTDEPSAASSSSSSAPSGSSSSASGSSSSSSAGVGRTVAVPVNDGVRGSVSSDKIAGIHGLVEFLLGASQVLTGDLDDVSSEELPVLAAALADMEYRDPFLLTTLAEAAIERQPELSESELLSLITSFAEMGRWFFDNRLLDQLTAEVVARAKDGLVTATAVDQVAAALDAINHKSKALQQYSLDRQDSSQ